MNKTNKSVFMIIIYFIIISPIIIALFLILNSENKISIHNVLNKKFITINCDYNYNYN